MNPKYFGLGAALMVRTGGKALTFHRVGHLAQQCHRLLPPGAQGVEHIRHGAADPVPGSGVRAAACLGAHGAAIGVGEPERGEPLRGRVVDQLGECLVVRVRGGQQVSNGATPDNDTGASLWKPDGCVIHARIPRLWPARRAERGVDAQPLCDVLFFQLPIRGLGHPLADEAAAAVLWCGEELGEQQGAAQLALFADSRAGRALGQLGDRQLSGEHVERGGVDDSSGVVALQDAASDGAVLFGGLERQEGVDVVASVSGLHC
ncbi:hypothetical protein [Streptomyces yaizuensis]|uniref:Uncharacterized protein n=1 Tax=Streptomyces yaizuensis TaxID=2989713 RepID=A0ABQ5NY13_9ACTN|nr:hypothetical protein [Streptomyces sp. YSPA8]GLF95248.1 hypothetical protein SYYSPA8_13145 [Streptomyces sp. YSPA8]